MPSEVSPSFSSVDDPSWLCGDRHSLCLDSVSDIVLREDSEGPRPVASWSHCEGGQYDILCEPVMILSASFCVCCIFPKLVSLAFVLQTGAA